MKKLFTILAVAATLVSCAKEDVVREAAREAIGFDNAFVENSTRSVNDPSWSNAKPFSNFAVYGTVEGAELFDKVEVSSSYVNAEQTKTSWDYAATQYWIAGAKYNFAAIAPYSNGVENVFTATKDTDDKYVGKTTFSFTNSGVNDLLYAQTPEIEGKASGNTAIEFTFRHILSKVKFSFKNGYNATNATIKVTDIKINNAYESATVTLGENSTEWTAQAQDTTNPLVLDFGAATDDQATTNVKENDVVAYAHNEIYESQNERFLIPGAVEGGYNVTFNVVLLVSGTPIDTYEHSVTLNLTPVAGNSYDVAAEITAANIDPEHSQEPIEFTVKTISDWTNNNPGMDVPVNQTTPTPGQN